METLPEEWKLQNTAKIGFSFDLKANNKGKRQ
jgi:hypothetical protein